MRDTPFPVVPLRAVWVWEPVQVKVLVLSPHLVWVLVEATVLVLNPQLSVSGLALVPSPPGSMFQLERQNQKEPLLVSLPGCW